MFRLVFIGSLLSLASRAESRGLLLLYRPHDISVDCAVSEHLRYDLTFGMGMSDTLTLVFRSMTELDYECLVEIGSQHYADNIYILIVMKFPNTIAMNCLYNSDAFTIVQNSACLKLCKIATARDKASQFFAMSTTRLFQFRFMSNSSINSDMNAYQYEVTVTTARKIFDTKKEKPCDPVNETLCMMDRERFCFTSGVVCDGIKNCGVTDWFDERGTECKLPAEGVGLTPVIAVAAALLCAALAATHMLFKCLPPLANSFFIFNSNEDNRFCIVPVFKSPDFRHSEPEQTRRISIIPVDYSSSDNENENEEQEGHTNELRSSYALQDTDHVISIKRKIDPNLYRKTTMKYFTDRFNKFRTLRSRPKDQATSTPAELEQLQEQ